MNATKKLMCILTAGTALVLAAPVFADSGRDRGYDHNRDRGHDHNRDHRYYNDYERHGYSGYRDPYRGYDRRHFVVVQRPILIERPVYYAEPVPMAYNPVAYNVGPAAIVGAVIGGFIDHRR